MREENLGGRVSEGLGEAGREGLEESWRNWENLGGRGIVIEKAA